MSRLQNSAYCVVISSGRGRIKARVLHVFSIYVRVRYDPYLDKFAFYIYAQQHQSITVSYLINMMRI